MSEKLRADLVVIGAGLAGLAAASEALDQGYSVLVLDRDREDALGGLARRSFGGIMFVDTPLQRRSKIHDSAELALADWLRYGELPAGDGFPNRWAKAYCEHSVSQIYDWLKLRGVQFMPVVNWPERGYRVRGNSLPRWHITWGTGKRLMESVIDGLDRHPNRAKLRLMFNCRVEHLIVESGRVRGCRYSDEDGRREFEVQAESTVVATGGICGGDLSLVRRHWAREWGDPPESLLNGSHRFADGLMHDSVALAGGVLANLDKQWHYAAGIGHPQPLMPDHGLSLVPPRSALWCNALGERIGPEPLVAYTDTRHLVSEILRQPGQYSWLVMNHKIARKELAVSGTEYMRAFVERRKLLLAKNLVLGNRELVDRLIAESEDVVAAENPDELAAGMASLALGRVAVDARRLVRSIRDFDREIQRGVGLINDEQLRRILNFRTYRGDRIRTCKFQPIDDPRARPLIAIRSRILARKSLGGIVTDLACRVLNGSGEPIQGLFAVGEAAGFGGGGIHGLRSLEGTFLGSCILTGRAAGRAVAGRDQPWRTS